MGLSLRCRQKEAHSDSEKEGSKHDGVGHGRARPSSIYPEICVYGEQQKDDTPKEMGLYVDC